MKRGLQFRMVLPASVATLFLFVGIACGDQEEVVELADTTSTPSAALSPTPTESPEERLDPSPVATPVSTPEKAGSGGIDSIAEFLSQGPWEKYDGDESLPGIYLLLDHDKFGAFLELSPDATFVLEAGQERYSGQWESDGGQLILSLTGFERPVIVSTDLGTGGVRWIGRPVQ